MLENLLMIASNKSDGRYNDPPGLNNAATSTTMSSGGTAASEGDSRTMGSSTASTTGTPSFYESWRSEIVSLKSRLDKQLQSMVETSQHEMDVLAATVVPNGKLQMQPSNEYEIPRNVRRPTSPPGVSSTTRNSSRQASKPVGKGQHQRSVCSTISRSSITNEINSFNDGSSTALVASRNSNFSARDRNRNAASFGRVDQHNNSVLDTVSSAVASALVITQQQLRQRQMLLNSIDDQPMSPGAIQRLRNQQTSWIRQRRKNNQRLLRASREASSSTPTQKQDKQAHSTMKDKEQQSSSVAPGGSPVTLPSSASTMSVGNRSERTEPISNLTRHVNARRTRVPSRSSNGSVMSGKGGGFGLRSKTSFSPSPFGEIAAIASKASSDLSHHSTATSFSRSISPNQSTSTAHGMISTSINYPAPINEEATTDDDEDDENVNIDDRQQSQTRPQQLQSPQNRYMKPSPPSDTYLKKKVLVDTVSENTELVLLSSPSREGSRPPTPYDQRHERPASQSSPSSSSVQSQQSDAVLAVRHDTDRVQSILSGLSSKSQRHTNNRKHADDDECGDQYSNAKEEDASNLSDDQWSRQMNTAHQEEPYVDEGYGETSSDEEPPEDDGANFDQYHEEQAGLKNVASPLPSENGSTTFSSPQSNSSELEIDSKQYRYFDPVVERRQISATPTSREYHSSIFDRMEELRLEKRDQEIRGCDAPEEWEGQSLSSGALGSFHLRSRPDAPVADNGQRYSTRSKLERNSSIGSSEFASNTSNIYSESERITARRSRDNLETNPFRNRENQELAVTRNPKQPNTISLAKELPNSTTPNAVVAFMKKLFEPQSKNASTTYVLEPSPETRSEQNIVAVDNPKSKPVSNEAEPIVLLDFICDDDGRIVKDNWSKISKTREEASVKSSTASNPTEPTASNTIATTTSNPTATTASNGAGNNMLSQTNQPPEASQKSQVASTLFKTKEIEANLQDSRNVAIVQPTRQDKSIQKEAIEPEQTTNTDGGLSQSIGMNDLANAEQPEEIKNPDSSRHFGERNILTEIPILKEKSTISKSQNPEKEKYTEDPALILKRTLTEDDSDDYRAHIVRKEEVSEIVVSDYSGEIGKYWGTTLKGKPDGLGTMMYDDGRTFTGEWRSGRWNGHGKSIFANGDSYTGDYLDDQRHGIGRYEWNDGRVYDGYFQHDQRHGRGTYSWPDGSVYNGDFKDGLRHGLGSYTFADGSVYTGEWEKGKYHGRGECRWKDGRCYKGEWQKGCANGFGIEIRPDGTVRHEGMWENNKPVRDDSVPSSLKETNGTTDGDGGHSKFNSKRKSHSTSRSKQRDKDDAHSVERVRSKSLSRSKESSSNDRNRSMSRSKNSERKSVAKASDERRMESRLEYASDQEKEINMKQSSVSRRSRGRSASNRRELGSVGRKSDMPSQPNNSKNPTSFPRAKSIPRNGPKTSDMLEQSQSTSWSRSLSKDRVTNVLTNGEEQSKKQRNMTLKSSDIPSDKKNNPVSYGMNPVIHSSSTPYIMPQQPNEPTSPVVAGEEVITNKNNLNKEDDYIIFLHGARVDPATEELWREFCALRQKQVLSTKSNRNGSTNSKEICLQRSTKNESAIVTQKNNEVLPVGGGLVEYVDQSSKPIRKVLTTSPITRPSNTIIHQQPTETNNIAKKSNKNRISTNTTSSSIRPIITPLRRRVKDEIVANAKQQLLQVEIPVVVGEPVGIFYDNGNKTDYYNHNYNNSMTMKEKYVERSNVVDSSRLYTTAATSTSTGHGNKTTGGGGGGSGGGGYVSRFINTFSSSNTTKPSSQLVVGRYHLKEDTNNKNDRSPLSIAGSLPLSNDGRDDIAIGDDSTTGTPTGRDELMVIRD